VTARPAHHGLRPSPDGRAGPRRPARPGGRWSAAVCVALVAATASCAGLVQYTDELRDERTGRTLIVRSPATAGGVVGFAVGLPVSAVALPVTYPVYLHQKRTAPMRADPVSTLLFPSFVLWRAGVLVAAPFDLVEWAVYRGWKGTPTRTAEERERIERDHDEEVLQTYPVEPIYPTARDLRRVDRDPAPG
jgi:hypothetical protein